jgi:hypothetical protein
MEDQAKRMVQLYTPRSEPDLLLLRSLFDDAGIRYHVRNDTFGSLYLGPHVEAYNRKILCVSEDDLDDGRALLAEFLERTGREADEPPPRTLLERLLQRVLDRFVPRPPQPEPPRLRLIRGGRTARGASPSEQRRRPTLRLVGRP